MGPSARGSGAQPSGHEVPERERAVVGAEQAAAAFPPLLVAAERVAATVAQGVHGRRRTGPGDAFWQFRRYLPGDPVQAVDWRQTAKADRPFVREHEWEAAQTVQLWCAQDAGMNWRSDARLPTKRERAVLLALALAALLLRGGERVGLLMPGERPSTGRTALYHLAEILDREGRHTEASGGAEHGDAAEQHRLPETALPRHASVVLFGDFLSPIDTVATALRGLAGRGARGHLVQILDPAEESLPFTGRVKFTDPGGRDSWLVNRTEDIRADYIERLLAHRDALRTLCRSLGWTFTLHHTDGPPEGALLSLHQTLSGALVRGGGR